MPVINVSVAWPAYALSMDEIQRLRDVAMEAVESEAMKTLDNTDQLIIRALRPTDLNETNAVWAETVSAVAGTGTNYEASQITAQSVPDDTVVCIYGLIDTSDPQPVTAIRVQSGQAVRAEWDMFPIIGSLRTDLYQRTMYAESPVIITKTINVEIQYYVRAWSPQVVRGVEIALLGFVAEKRGKQIEP